MGLFTRGLGKPGKGIDPDEPQKRSFFLFFDIFFRKFWHFMRLNLLYAVTLLPTFIIVFFLSGVVSNGILSVIVDPINSLAQETGGDAINGAAQIIVLVDLIVRFAVTYLFVVLLGMGPATAGISYVLRNFARQEHAWLWSDFKDAAKSNFKQSIIVFVIDIVVVGLLYFAWNFYVQFGGIMGAMRYPILIVGIIYVMMHFYLYQMMVTFKLSLKNLYKNALLFALGKLPSNILVLILLLGIHLGLAYLAIMLGGNYAVLCLLVLLVLEVFILLAFSAFIVSFNAYPKMKKYMLLDSSIELKPDVNNDDDEESNRTEEIE